MSRSTRAAQLTALLLVGVCGVPHAQDVLLPHSDDGSATQPPASGSVTTLDTVNVTGTHIRDVDLETEHPLQVLQRADLLRTGLTGVADIVQSLIIANGQTLNRNINNAASGELRVNLRSLGANRTLVLINGQRWVSALDGAVDLSAIPLALVERIEVLKDGASAIYGSDAIGGVINIITRKNYDGAELGLYAGQSDHDDGLSRHADLAFGRNGKRWHAAAGLEVGKDDPIFAGARAISSVPIPGLPLSASGSSATQYGNFFVPGRGRRVLIPGRPGTSPDDFRRQDPALDNNYDFVPYNYLQTPQERRAGFAQGRWDASPTLAFSADVLYDQRRSAQQLAPPVVTFSTAGFGLQGFEVAADNVYNPFGVPVTRVFTRWPDNEPRRFEQTVDTARFHLGIDGMSGFAGRDWIWGIDATRTHAAQREYVSPYADNQRLALAVGPSFLDGNGIAHCGTPNEVIAGCVPLDLFTGPGRFTQAMLDYVDVDIHNTKRGRSDVLDAHATTTLADLPAGPLGFAAGAERRLDRGRDDPDPLIASGRANGTGETFDPTAGAYAVNEAYAEFDIPLLSEKPFARQLDVNLATRYSDYSLFGGTDNSRIGLRWKPLDDVLLRTTWAEGFRAPSLFEAFGGADYGGGDAVDVCASDEGYVPPSAVAARCRAQGVPADVQPPAGFVAITGSNRDLKPETSRSLTAGLVWSPDALPGIDASLDWYRIQIRNAISNLGPQGVIDACYKNGDTVACSRITRNAEGELSTVLATNQNLPGGIETEGWDFALAWKRVTSAGQFNLRWENAYVSYWGDIGKPARGALLPDGSLAQGNIAGSSNALYGVVWRLRSVATLAWQRGAWGASLSARYFSPIAESCSRVTEIADAIDDPALRQLCSDPDRVVDDVPAPRNRVGSVTYVDLEASWQAPWKARFTLGLRNALDRNPPVSYSAYANSFFPDYDVPGRFWYASYRQAF